MIFGRIETVMLSRLDAASKQRVLGYSYRTIDTLPDDLEGLLASHVQAYPAIWTSWGGFRKLALQGDGSVLVEARYSLVAAASSQRNERAQRHGVEGEVGSYQLIQDAAALLMDQTFGLDMSPLELGDCTPIVVAGQAKLKASFFAVNFTTKVEIDPTAAPLIVTPDIGDFATFAVAWDLPPHTGAGDLNDLQTLPQEA